MQRKSIGDESLARVGDTSQLVTEKTETGLSVIFASGAGSLLGITIDYGRGTSVNNKPITRPQWAKKHRVCMVCGTKRHLQTHEIANGPARQAALKEPATWLRLCDGFINGCHAALHDKGEWPVAKALALKKFYDPDNYDRVAVNLLRDRQPDAITEAEVDQWVQQMEGERDA